MLGLVILLDRSCKEGLISQSLEAAVIELGRSVEELQFNLIKNTRLTLVTFVCKKNKKPNVSVNFLLKTDHVVDQPFASVLSFKCHDRSDIILALDCCRHRPLHISLT
jgi:hypothetical protein